MRPSIALAAALLVPQDLVPPVGEAFGAGVERVGEHFRIASDIPADDAADQALSAAEAAWPIAVGLLGDAELRPAEPLLIVLHRDAARYEAAESRMTKGRFKQNLSFSHWDTKTAHVALQPPCSREALAELGLPLQTLRSIAHEAAHLACYEALPNYRYHPTWFAEGLACRVEELALRSLGRSTASEEEPYFSSLIARCQRLAGAAALPSLDDLIAERLDALPTSDAYAVRALFFEYLIARRPAEVARVVEGIRAVGVRPATAAAIRGNLRSLWPPERAREIDREFGTFLAGKEPRWDEVFRSLETSGDGYLQRAFEDRDALALNREEIDALPYVAEGALRVLAGEPGELRFLLGRRQGAWFVVAFEAGSGVSVSRFHGGDDPGTTIARVGAKEVASGKEVAFRIECTERAITVALDGDELLFAPIEESPLGSWGLGARKGSTGEWKRVRVEVERQ